MNAAGDGEGHAVGASGDQHRIGLESVAELIGGDPYGSAFYITTGFHGIHVSLGLIAFLLVIGRIYAVKNFTHKEETTAVVVSYYWHFVDIVWIALFIVIYMVK